MKAPYLPIFGITIFGLLFFGPGLLVGFYAKRKNHNFWIWFLLSSAAVIVGFIIGNLAYEHPSKSPYSIFSFILWSVVYIFIRFAPSKCPKCKRTLEKPEWKQETCPECGEFAEVRQPKPRMIKPVYVGPLSLVLAIIPAVVIPHYLKPLDWDIYLFDNIFRIMLVLPFFFFIIYILIHLVVFIRGKFQHKKKSDQHL